MPPSCADLHRRRLAVHYMSASAKSAEAGSHGRARTAPQDVADRGCRANPQVTVLLMPVPRAMMLLITLMLDSTHGTCFSQTQVAPRFFTSTLGPVIHSVIEGGYRSVRSDAGAVGCIDVAVAAVPAVWHAVVVAAVTSAVASKSGAALPKSCSLADPSSHCPGTRGSSGNMASSRESLYGVSS